MPRRQLAVQLLHLAEPFDRWCAQAGKKRSAVVRALVANAIGEPLVGTTAQMAVATKSTAREQAPVARYWRSQVRLSEEEKVALQRQAEAAGLSASRYVATLLMVVNEGRMAIAGKVAVKALTESNHHLAGIGRSLHLAARLLHRAPEHGAESDVDGVQEAIDLLRQHLVRAAAVLADVERTRIFPRTESQIAVSRRRRSRREPSTS